MKTFFCLILVFALSGCGNNMKDQPRYEPLEKSDFYENRLASRAPVPGTVSRGNLKEDEWMYRGEINGKLTDEFPFPVTKDVMKRGQERYDIYCAVCHDRLGYGEGMVVRRGFTRPPSFHAAEVREKPAGHYYQVISNGFGAMQDYASQIKPEDRWAVVAYIRALQFSQNAKLDDIPAGERAKLVQNP